MVFIAYVYKYQRRPVNLYIQPQTVIKTSHRSHNTTMGYNGECDSDFIRTTALEDSVHMKLFF